MKILLRLLPTKFLPTTSSMWSGWNLKLRTVLVLFISLVITGAWSCSATALEPLSIESAPKAVGENSDLTYTPQWPEPPNAGAMLLRLAIGTVVVLVLCVGSLWFAKPWLQKMQVGSTGSPLLQIQGSVALGSRAVLHLIKIGDTQMVAGTDATGLKSLVVVPTSFREVLDAQLPAAEPVLAAAEYFDVRHPAPAGSKE